MNTQADALSADTMWILADEPWYSRQFGGPALPRKTTLNNTVASVFDHIGQVLFNTAMHQDSRMYRTPSSEPVFNLAKGIEYLSRVLLARQVTEAEIDSSVGHVTPAEIPFLVHPMPLGSPLLRNPWLQMYVHLCLGGLSQIAQHTENERRGPMVSDRFAKACIMPFNQVYKLIARELLGLSKEATEVPGFAITDEQWKAYAPSKLVPSTEDTQAVLAPGDIPTEYQVRAFREGLVATNLPRITTFRHGTPGAGAEFPGKFTDDGFASSGAGTKGNSSTTTTRVETLLGGTTSITGN